MCKQVWKWAPTHHLFVSARVSVIFSTTGTVAIFPLCSGDNEVPLHRASDRLIKNVIGSVNHILAQRGVGQAGGWAAAAVTGGRPDNRITCREWGHKWKEEAIVRCSSCPEALRTVTDIGEGFKGYKYLSVSDVALMQLHQRPATVRPSVGHWASADVDRRPLQLIQSQHASSLFLGLLYSSLHPHDVSVLQRFFPFVTKALTPHCKGISAPFGQSTVALNVQEHFSMTKVWALNCELWTTPHASSSPIVTAAVEAMNVTIFLPLSQQLLFL